MISERRNPPYVYILPISPKKKKKKVPMNPDVSLAEKDVLKRPLFRDDNKLFTRVMSEEFQDILRTDPTS